MIAEDYVSFETAKLLKDKGFDVPTEEFYNQDGLYCRGASPYNWNDDKDIDDGCADYSRPSIYIAMKWLREVHRIFIRIIQSHIDYCCFEVYWNRGDYYKPMTFCNSYEQACEVAIKYCLENLI